MTATLNLTAIEQARLQRFTADVRQALGDQVVDIRLFGSRARGDAGPDSDYDVAVLVREIHDRSALRNLLFDLGWKITEAVADEGNREFFRISARAILADSLNPTHPAHTFLARNIAAEGVSIG